MQLSTTSPIVILGGSGFIGTRLTHLLASHDFPVRIGDIRQNTASLGQWSKCDVRDIQSIQKIVDGASVIINLAAEHRDDVRPLSLYQETNVGGAVQVCAAARQANIKKIIFTSSVAVYGFQPHPVDENGPFNPFNAYGKTKLEAESVYMAWANEDPTRSLVIVRPTVVFGESNRGNVYNLLHQIATDRFLMVGSGENIKSIAYVGNVSAFLMYVMKLGCGTHIFNYVDGPDMNTKDMVLYIRSSLGKPGNPLSIPKFLAITGGHTLDLIARVSKRSFPISAVRVRKFCENTRFSADQARQIGFVAPYTLREALDRTIQFEFPRE